MKTFYFIWNIIFAVLIIVFAVISIIDYRKTKDNTEISPEDIKVLRRKYFFLVMFFCAYLLIERIGRFFPL